VKKQIVIVGGGTAGWLSALHTKKIYGNDADIILIESEEIGILGAGEGSTAVLVSFIRGLGIDINNFLREVNGTHKIGVSFENWNGDGSKYIHDFFSTDTKVNPTARIEYIGYAIKNNFPLDEYLVSKKLAYDNMCPVLLDGREVVHNSFHFDAHLVAKYLRKIAESRGVIRIEGVVSDFELDEYEKIKSISLKDNKKIKTDFIFDCSGFARLIIGNVYKSQWISYKHRLTVNSALPFQLPPDTDHIKPYTKAIAMKYGWVWQIPLQNRWGCGYVFDDNYIEIDEAKAEIESTFDIKIENNRVIKFEAGRFNEIWIKNCIAVGLSGSFVEPLEATSIGMTVALLKSLTRQDIDFLNVLKVNSYNLNFNEYMDDIVDFLQYHYITDRNDTPFWEFYKDENNWSNQLKKHIAGLTKDLRVKLDRSIFVETSYTTVGFGLQQLKAEQFVQRYEVEKQKRNDLENIFRDTANLTKRLNSQTPFVSEFEFIKQLKENKI